MLAYKNIYEVAGAQERLARTHSYLWTTEHSQASDQLTVFTFGTQAEEDSKNNLELCLETGRRHGAELAIIHPYKVQFVGQRNSDDLANEIFPQSWCDEYSTWVGNTRLDRYRALTEQSDRSEVLKFDTNRRCVVQRGHYGVYDLASGQRIKNRREIIQRIWDHGFASWRGHPLSIARLRWSGNRQELTELATLADRYWSRYHKSDVATKIVSAYRSINRYAAWPGAW